jgi:peptidoglycan/LPS O-acetylase OafA/YrhL
MMSFISYIPLVFLPFALGAGLALIEGRIVAHPRAATIAIFIGLFFGSYEYTTAFTWLPDLLMHDFTLLGRHYVLSPAVGYYDLGAFLLVGGAIGSRTAAVLLNRSFFQMLGRASFGVYLLHWPIILSFSIWVVRSLDDAAVSYPLAVGLGGVATILLTIPLGLLFHRLIDAPTVTAVNQLAKSVIIMFGSGVKTAGRGAARAASGEEASSGAASINHAIQRR